MIRSARPGSRQGNRARSATESPPSRARVGAGQPVTLDSHRIPGAQVEVERSQRGGRPRRAHQAIGARSAQCLGQRRAEPLGDLRVHQPIAWPVDRVREGIALGETDDSRAQARGGDRRVTPGQDVLGAPAADVEDRRGLRLPCSPLVASRTALVATTATRSAPARRARLAYSPTTVAVRAAAASAWEPVAARPWPNRVTCRSVSTTRQPRRPGSTSAMSRRTVFGAEIDRG